MPKINKFKSDRRARRVKEDEHTKMYIIENNQTRTVVDMGGDSLIMGLEFTNLYNVQEKGELEVFVEILKLLEKRNDVKSVEIIIAELQEGKKGKRFSRLSDGITKRRYAIGKIVIMDGREYSLIEIERETRSLSMLILKVNTYVNWNWVYSKVLIGLINESDRWSNESINAIHNFEILTCRIKHQLKLNYGRIITLIENFSII